MHILLCFVFSLFCETDPTAIHDIVEPNSAVQSAEKQLVLMLIHQIQTLEITQQDTVFGLAAWWLSSFCCSLSIQPFHSSRVMRFHREKGVTYRCRVVISVANDQNKIDETNSRHQFSSKLLKKIPQCPPRWLCLAQARGVKWKRS